MNTLFSPRSRQQHEAFSLLEVAFALVIFVIGALAILRIFPTGLDVLETTGKNRTATRVADEYIGRVSQPGEENAPQAVYNAEFGGGLWNWTDFPGSMASTKEQSLGMPKTADDLFNSSLGNLRFVRGRRVPTFGYYNSGFTGYVATPDVADRQIILASREGIVKGVSIGNTGEVDFANATYSRSDLRSVPVDYPFHEPTVGDQNARTFPRPAPDATSTQTITLPVSLNSSLQGVDLNLANYCNASNPRIAGSSRPSVVVRAVPATAYGATVAQSAVEGTDYSFGTGATISSTGQRINVTSTTTTSPPPLPPSATSSVVLPPLTIYNPSGSPSTENKYFYLELSSGSGISVLYSRVLVCIQNASDAVTDPATAPVVRCAVRPPWWMRKSGATGNVDMPYYFSYQYTNGAVTQGVTNEPLVFPADDIGSNPAQPLYPQSCDAGYGPTSPGRVLAAYRGITTIQGTTDASLRFRQPIQNYAQTAFSELTIGNTYQMADVTNLYDNGNLSYAVLDYSVRGWDFFSDHISNASAPLTQSLVGSSNNSDADLLQTAFIGTGLAPYPQNIREFRTPFGNVQTPIGYCARQGWQDGSMGLLSYATISGITSAKEAKGILRFGKDGRIYFPVSDAFSAGGTRACPPTEPSYNGSGACPVSHAIPYAYTKISFAYRSKEGWMRQLGVVADRYMPYIPDASFTLPAGITRVREPWREYVFNGGKLYFHATEAGKTVAVKFASGVIRNVELDDDLVSSAALGAANSGFVDTTTNPQGKVAVSLETLSTTDGIVDVGSPDTINNVPANSVRDISGSGIIVRTAWQNNTKYLSTYAASGNVTR